MSDSGKETILSTSIEPAPFENRIINSAEAILQKKREALNPKQRLTASNLRMGKGISLTLAAVLFLASVGCGNRPEPKTLVEATSTPVALTSDSSSKSDAGKSPENQQLYKYLSVGRVNIALDQSGMPVKYTVDKNEVNLDRTQLEQIKQKAIQEGEIQIANIIVSPEVPEQLTPVTGSIEHPVLRELPKDVLTEQELREKGIEVIQADNTYLYIRRQAFEKGGPLEQFNNTGRKIKIVLINGPVASAEFMKDPKYDTVRRIIYDKDQEVEKYREEKVKVLEQALNQMRQNLKSAPRDNIQEIKSLENNMLSFKVILDTYKNKSTAELVYEISSHSDAAGYYATPRLIGGDRSTAAVFVSVGRSNLPKREKAVIAFHSNGEMVVSGNVELQGIGFEPSPSQSYPNPKDFPLNKSASPADSRPYPYGGTTAGQVLLHELKHDKLITQNFLDGLRPNFSEYDTDMGAMERIRKGWEKWEKSGYKDNTGFYFIFKLPGNQGYIVVQQPSIAKTPEAFHT